ncbi:hypothetical protein [Saccharopolyspora sp. NFXS83]|uniref:hypothetical protein n=1 Tax=Saccharopolyspora sp. NFXS83 TaxID=2993560 RepID=UPI003A4DAEF3
MHRCKISRADAFEMLQKSSQSRNVELRTGHRRRGRGNRLASRGRSTLTRVAPHPAKGSDRRLPQYGTPSSVDGSRPHHLVAPQRRSPSGGLKACRRCA